MSMDTFLYNAISEGLKRDKITRELALEVAAKDQFFIGKCNICKGVRRAFMEHSGFTNEHEMIGQVENLKMVKSIGPVGKEEMISVVKTYLDQHIQDAKLSKSQKEALQKELMQESEKGSLLVTAYNFCPSCTGTEGSCKADQEGTEAKRMNR